MIQTVTLPQIACYKNFERIATGNKAMASKLLYYLSMDYLKLIRNAVALCIVLMCTTGLTHTNGDEAAMRMRASYYHMFLNDDGAKIILDIDKNIARQILNLVAPSADTLNEELLDSPWHDFEKVATEVYIGTTEEDWYQLRRYLWQFYLAPRETQYWVFYYLRHRFKMEFSDEKKTTLSKCMDLLKVPVSFW